jgi:heme/copper-type cytochrome/quinol oxidase subunit 2
VGGTGSPSANIDSSSDLTLTANGGTVIIPVGESIQLQFTATPTVIGTFDNPRDGGHCEVDPDDKITEGNEGNNTSTDSVTVTAPDLTASKSNDVSAATTLGNHWTWTLTVQNTGNHTATFNSGETILLDNLPDANVNYGTVNVTPSAGVGGTGSPIANIDGSSDLTLTASGGTVTIPAGESIQLQFTATPTVIGTFDNPRDGGSCEVDPDGEITESNEGNNTATTDSVAITAPDLTVSKSNDVSGATILGNHWTWTVTIQNTGNHTATFSSGETILLDNLPDANVNYGTVNVTPSAGVGGTGSPSANIDSNRVSNRTG